jgi:5'-3' exonuclease
MKKREYIKELEEGWKERYKKQLKQKGNEVKEYKKGLEWTLKYYIGKKYRKDWVYKSNYGPLLSEMCEISHQENIASEDKDKENEWITAKVQLAYVLPIGSHEILPKKTAKYLQDNHRDLYPKKYKYQWDYCRYFWEAHPIIPEISLEQLLEWNNNTTEF